MSDEKIQRVNTIYPTRTKTTEAYRYTLKELESETFLKIIRGESELSAFNEFVKEWQEEGGNEIIQEMIQERKSLNSQEEQKTEEKQNKNRRRGRTHRENGALSLFGLRKRILRLAEMSFRICTGVEM